MNQIFTNILKAIGVLVLSAAIFFMFEPKEEVKNQAVNLALEFLGKRLLAMVPEGHEHEIETRFNAVREQALKGEINDEQLQDFTTIVLNAQAEGQPLPIAEIDSALAALHQSEAQVAVVDEARQKEEEQRLEQWAQRMQEFERFEKRWHTIVPDSNLAQTVREVRRVRPLYRLSKQFVVQIDSAALASAVGFAFALSEDSLSLRAMAGHPPPPPHFRTLIRKLEGEHGKLRVEVHSGDFEQQRRWADSLRVHAEKLAREHREMLGAVPPHVPAPPMPERQPPPRRN